MYWEGVEEWRVDKLKAEDRGVETRGHPRTLLTLAPNSAHQRREPAIQIVIEVRKRSVHPSTNLYALQGSRSGEDGDLGGGLESVNRRRLIDLRAQQRQRALLARVIPQAHLIALEDCRVEVAEHLLANESDVSPEVLSSQADLDKPLLLHEDVIRNVVHDLGAEDAEGGEFRRGGEGGKRA